MVASKKIQRFPDWYYRVISKIDLLDDQPVPPYEFDEDLSELEKEDEQEEDEQQCDCDGWHCECDDGKSIKSFDGSEAEFYYELKEQRKDRKRELARMEKAKKETTRKMLVLAREKEREVEAAYRGFLDSAGKKRKRKSSEPACGIDIQGHFELHSSQYIQVYNEPRYGNIEFYYNRAWDTERHDRIKTYLRLDDGAQCRFQRFTPPNHAGPRKYRLKSDDEDDVDCIDGGLIKIQFVSNDCLRLKISSQLLFSETPRPSHCLDFFKFVGIRRDVEKERGERERKRARLSPRETWFERTHPMGSWNSGF